MRYLDCGECGSRFEVATEGVGKDSDKVREDYSSVGTIIMVCSGCGRQLKQHVDVKAEIVNADIDVSLKTIWDKPDDYQERKN